MNKKYAITDKSIKLENGVSLYRIIALRDFSDVKKGDFGGYIQSESNLSHDMNCWVYDNSKVMGNARVFHNAKVLQNSEVKDNAWAYDNSRVADNSIVSGNIHIFHDTNISNKANIR